VLVGKQKKERRSMEKDNLFADNIIYGPPNDLRNVINLCKIQPTCNDVFIDIGSRCGEEIDFFTQYGMTIDSFEAHPITFDFLCNKYRGEVTLNKEIQKNVLINQSLTFSITNAAVWNSQEEKIFYFKESPNSVYWGHHDGGSTLMGSKSTISTTSGCKVQTIDIADIIRSWNHKKIKILKIDAEGVEYHLLKRLIDTGLIFKPEFIFFEDHGEKINSEEFFKLKEFVLDFKEKNNLKFYKW
jgi:FkbM family methyltransferase